MHHGVVLQKAGEFVPLAVLPGVDHALGLGFEPDQGADLDLELVDGARGGGLVEHVLGPGFVLAAGQLVVGVKDVLRDVLDVISAQGLGDLMTVLVDQLLTQTRFQLLAAAFE